MLLGMPSGVGQSHYRHRPHRPPQLRVPRLVFQGQGYRAAAPASHRPRRREYMAPERSIAEVIPASLCKARIHGELDLPGVERGIGAGSCGPVLSWRPYPRQRFAQHRDCLPKPRGSSIRGSRRTTWPLGPVYTRFLRLRAGKCKCACSSLRDSGTLPNWAPSISANR